MPDTHDERGGDEAVKRKPRIVPELTEELLRTIPVPIAAAVWQLMLREKLRDQQLAAATARAESATVLPERWRALIVERDAANERAEKAEARLAERRPIRAEWSTENVYSHPSDDVISQGLAARRVIAHPNIHTAVLRRQLYAGPWVPAADACRSCGEIERVAGDPPLCSNCAAYGATYRGVACWPPIAAPDGLSEPVERSETSGGSFQANTSASPAAGLSEPEDGRDTSAWCWAPNPHTLLHCGLLRDHEPPHRRGERTWTDDTTEDGQHG
jgi:hypothetical protein